MCNFEVSGHVGLGAAFSSKKEAERIIASGTWETGPFKDKLGSFLMVGFFLRRSSVFRIVDYFP